MNPVQGISLTIRTRLKQFGIILSRKCGERQLPKTGQQRNFRNNSRGRFAGWQHKNIRVLGNTHRESKQAQKVKPLRAPNRACHLSAAGGTAGLFHHNLAAEKGKYHPFLLRFASQRIGNREGNTQTGDRKHTAAPRTHLKDKRFFLLRRRTGSRNGYLRQTERSQQPQKRHHRQRQQKQQHKKGQIALEKHKKQSPGQKHSEVKQAPAPHNRYRCRAGCGTLRRSSANTSKDVLPLIRAFALSLTRCVITSRNTETVSCGTT